MNNSRVIQILWIVALVVLATGVVMTVGNFRMIQKQAQLIESKRKVYQDLAVMNERMEFYKGAVGEFQKLSSSRVVSLRDLMAKSFPGGGTDDLRETRSESLAGWFVRDAEIVLNNVKFSKVMEFVADVERMRPPWVLKKCVITASSGEDGAGGVILTLSGLSLPD